VFNPKIVDLGKRNLIELGFVWHIRSEPTIEKSERFVIQETPATGVYKQRISTTLERDSIYYVRAYIKNPDYITYGKSVSFTSSGSIAPIISGFKPEIGNLGDTLIILGQNFSYKLENNKVHFNEFQANVIKATQDSLFVLVPDNLDSKSSYISVSILNRKVTSDDEFTLISPEFNDFYPKTGKF
jgi:hypothetical protein